ncbi:MAG: hypothetical protein ACREA2_06725, partial [Blastocatellia bacterium]
DDSLAVLIGGANITAMPMVEASNVPYTSRLPPPVGDNVRQKNEDQSHSLFFCLTFFCLVAETMIKVLV